MEFWAIKPSFLTVSLYLYNIYALTPSLKMCYLLSSVGETETQKTSNARVGNEKVDQLSKSC